MRGWLFLHCLAVYLPPGSAKNPAAGLFPAGQAANNLGLTSMEILGSAVIGAGLRVMNDVGGEWGAAAKIGSRVTTRLTSVVRF